MRVILPIAILSLLVERGGDQCDMIGGEINTSAAAALDEKHLGFKISL